MPTKPKRKKQTKKKLVASKKPIKRHVDEYSQVMREETSTDKCLTSFVPKPKRLTIDIQAHDEDIILLVRQHVFTQVKWVAVVIVMLILPLLFSITNIFSFMPVTYQIAGLVFWLMLIFGFSIESFF